MTSPELDLEALERHVEGGYVLTPAQERAMVARLRAAEAERDRLQRLVDDWQTMGVRNVQRRGDLQAERDDLRERLAKAEAERDEAREECEEHRRQYEAESQTSYALERKLEAAEARVRALEQDRDDAHRQLDSLSEALDRVRELEAQLDAMSDAAATPVPALVQIGRENAALRAVAARLAEWTHEYGAALKPVRADTFGDGMREAKSQVSSILAALPEGGGT